MTWPIFRALNPGIPAALATAATPVAMSSGRLSCEFGIHLSDAKLVPITSRISSVELNVPFSHQGDGLRVAAALAGSVTSDGPGAGTLDESQRPASGHTVGCRVSLPLLRFVRRRCCNPLSHP